MTRSIAFALIWFASTANAQYSDTVLISPIPLDQQMVSILQSRIANLYAATAASGAHPFEYPNTSGLVMCVPDTSNNRNIVNERAYRFCLSPMDPSSDVPSGFLQADWCSDDLKEPYYTMYLAWLPDEKRHGQLAMMVFYVAKDAKGNVMPEEVQNISSMAGPESIILRDLETIVSKRIELQSQKR